MFTEWIRAAETVLCSRLRNPGRGEKSNKGRRKRRVKKKMKYQSDPDAVDSRLVDASKNVVKTVLRQLSKDGVVDMTVTPPQLPKEKMEQVTSVSSGVSKGPEKTSLSSIISANMVCSITSHVIILR
jgi:ribosomal protein S19E (S16A)